MSTEANTAQLRRLADEVLTGHNLAALDEIFHADYVENEPPPGMGPGREGLRQWLARWIAAFPDVRWTVEEQIADEDRVWSRSIWQGTHQGSFLGIPPPERTSPWRRGPSTGSQTAKSPKAGSSWTLSGLMTLRMIAGLSL
jgi:predicted ester cyclase